MKATMTETQKIKISSNDFEIDSKKSDAEHSLKLITDLLIHYKKNEVEFSDDELNGFIRGNFSLPTFERIATEKYKDSPKRERRDLILGFIEDAQLHTAIFQTAYLIISQYVEVKNGKATIRKEAFQEIEDRYTYYINDQKSIELFKRHQDLILQLNDLKDDINNNAHNGVSILNTAHLAHFDKEGNVYAPAINYGK